VIGDRRTSVPDWSLTPRGDDETGPSKSGLPRRRVLTAVARRGLPGIVEASLVPSVIFAITTGAFGATVAMLAVMTWGYATILRRVLTGRAIPSLLLLAMFGLTVKTLLGVVSGSTFLYFLQPVATTLAIGAAFFGSALVGRPVIARIAHDFCPISAEVACRPSVMRLFTGLTLLWATVQFVNAGATVGMLFSLPTALFVLLKPATSLFVSATGVVITVWWALRTARREELVFAMA
jgi:hypothetical protein